MKLIQQNPEEVVALSLPVRGAWIEISTDAEVVGGIGGRSPCGERGLKSPFSWPFSAFPGSLPVRGAWIEIGGTHQSLRISDVAPRAGSVD